LIKTNKLSIYLKIGHIPSNLRFKTDFIAGLNMQTETKKAMKGQFSITNKNSTVVGN